MIIAEKGNMCTINADGIGTVKPGCWNETDKCVPIVGTTNCKVAIECFCDSSNASKVGDICEFS